MKTFKEFAASAPTCPFCPGHMEVQGTDETDMLYECPECESRIHKHGLQSRMTPLNEFEEREFYARQGPVAVLYGRRPPKPRP